MLRGALAAAVTPLDGDRLDEAAVPPLCRLPRRRRAGRPARAGDDRRRAPFGVDERSGRSSLPGGRRRTPAGGRPLRRPDDRDTVALAAHAAETGADAVAVIGPPYFPLDERPFSITSSRPQRPARRCPSTSTSSSARAVTPFRCRCARAARARVEPGGAQGLGRAVRQVLALPVEGLDVFVGPEALIYDGISAARSAPSPGSPRRIRRRSQPSCGSRREAGATELGELRAAVERFPRHAALKFILGLRGSPSVRTSGDRSGS